MMDIDVKLKKELIKTTNDLRKKYKALRNGREAYETQLEEALKPITIPLNELVKKSSKTPEENEEREQSVFETPIKKVKHNLDKDEFITPSSNSSSPFSPSNKNTPKTHDETSRGRKRTRSLRVSHRDFVEQLSEKEFPNIPQKYIDLFINNSTLLDSVYGIRLENEKLYIGNGEFNIYGKNIKVKDKILEGTEGLYELIFKKVPDEKVYNTRDLTNYKSILLETNAHRVSHDPGKQINGNRGHKYKLIKSLFENTFTPSTGSGLMQLSKAKDYIFWDDPNELVDRLKLLIGSQQAGNNNHTNEIISIIEELKESDIIEY